MKILLSSCQWALFLLFFTGGSIYGQKDANHYSSTFRMEKPYRIFLPADYSQSQKRYPVIYFFHGNFGNHEFNLEGIDQLVDENAVILVAWNGRSLLSDRRPYNIGNHSDVKYNVQFKDYILELITHIDSMYRTLHDRAHRAFMGHSMGGFMAFVLAGKYPQLVGTAVNLKGAPEFFMGYPENHTLYPLRYMFKNLYGVNLRFHNSTVDELVHLNREVHQGAFRENGLVYTYQVYPGGHDYTPYEFREAFNFIVSSFNNPLPRPLRWHHADLYNDFEVWDYHVKSNLNEPGFIDLKGVSKGGMQISTRKWQPDGPFIPGIRIDITTAPVYQPATPYTLFDFNETQNTKHESIVRSDAEGRINFSLNHETHQIGIYKKNDLPEIVFAEYKVNGKGIFLDHRKPCKLSLRLLNRGARATGKFKVTLNTSTEGVSIENPALEGDKFEPGDLVWLPSDFTISPFNKPTTDGSPFRIRFNLTVTDNKGNIWKDEFDAPVFYEVPAFTKIGIDDWDKGVIGSGNGNNIPEPGETIMIYEGSHRTRLYYDDPYVRDVYLHDDLAPDKWGGDGFALSSLIQISKDCPVGHQIKFLASYEEKEWKTIKRNVTWGNFTITIGKEPDYK